MNKSVGELVTNNPSSLFIGSFYNSYYVNLLTKGSELSITFLKKVFKSILLALLILSSAKNCLRASPYKCIQSAKRAWC